MYFLRNKTRTLADPSFESLLIVLDLLDLDFPVCVQQDIHTDTSEHFDADFIELMKDNFHLLLETLLVSIRWTFWVFLVDTHPDFVFLEHPRPFIGSSLERMYFMRLLPF